MLNISFIKMHGLGNDFVMLDKLQFKDESEAFFNKLAIAISNRYTGIGCDQLIVYQQDASKAWVMEIYNSNGSKAKACGNGARCLAKIIHNNTGLLSFNIRVGGRLLACKVKGENNISVNMGIAKFTADWILLEEKIWSFAKNYNLNPREIICVDMGNPHLVIFSEGLNDDDKKLLGAKISASDLFPEGININFAQVKNNNILLQVWERGVGFTLSCGSGTCASFAAACRLGYIREDQDCQVIFKLGALNLQFNEVREVILSGPADLVARGEYYYAQ